MTDVTLPLWCLLDGIWGVLRALAGLGCRHPVPQAPGQPAGAMLQMRGEGTGQSSDSWRESAIPLVVTMLAQRGFRGAAWPHHSWLPEFDFRSLAPM